MSSTCRAMSPHGSKDTFLADPVEDAAVESFQNLVVVEILSVALVPKKVLADRTVHQLRRVLVLEAVHKGRGSICI